MNKITAGEAQSDGGEAGSARLAAPTAEVDAVAARMVVRVRSLMIISGLTTLLAIAAVVAVIGYRVFCAADGGAAATTEAVIILPKGARVVTSTVADDRIVVTLDVAGSPEIRTFNLKTFREIGRIRFAIEP